MPRQGYRGRGKCQHCRKDCYRHAGNLCYACLKTPDVRRLFVGPPPGKEDFNGPAPLGEPTTALPGTDAKIKVLEDRASKNQALFHPQDARDMTDEQEKDLRLLKLIDLMTQTEDNQ